jgi:protein-disulfide isomerase
MEDMDSKLTVYLLLGLALGLVLGGSIGYLYALATYNVGTTAKVDAPSQTQQPQITGPPATPPQTPPPEIIDIDMEELVDDDPAKGDENAPVVIVEFSDFQCPFCERWAQETLPQLTQTYIDTGKVKLVYRDFPLSSIHPEAQKAAEAAECARDQGKFWEYHDTLFENRMDWTGVGAAKFKQYSADLGLDTNAFDDCLDSDKYKDEVLNDLNAGGSVGVTGTPTFFINGKKLVGAQPFENFKTAIEEALA